MQRNRVGARGVNFVLCAFGLFCCSNEMRCRRWDNARATMHGYHCFAVLCRTSKNWFFPFFISTFCFAPSNHDRKISISPADYYYRCCCRCCYCYCHLPTMMPLTAVHPIVDLLAVAAQYCHRCLHLLVSCVQTQTKESINRYSVMIKSNQFIWGICSMHASMIKTDTASHYDCILLREH